MLSPPDRSAGTAHDGGRLRAAVSCSAPQRVTPDYFAALDDLSRAHDLPLLYPYAGDQAAARAGRAEVRRPLADPLRRTISGCLSTGMNIIHAVWIDDADIDLIAEAGCGRRA